MNGSGEAKFTKNGIGVFLPETGRFGVALHSK